MLKIKDRCYDFWIFIYDESDKCFFLARNNRFFLKFLKKNRSWQSINL